MYTYVINSIKKGVNCLLKDSGVSLLFNFIEKKSYQCYIQFVVRICEHLGVQHTEEVGVVVQDAQTQAPGD